MNELNPRFEFAEIDTLPRLAWCAEVKRGVGAVRVAHGPWVETRGEFFCEGAWSGEFAFGEFPDATVFLGSGGAISGKRVRFATSTHTYERLHLLRDGDRILVSNSLAFLLAQAGDSYDPTYPFYDVDLMSFKNGLKLAARSIPTRRGNQVHLCYCCNLLIDERLEVVQTPKNYCAPFRGYDDYVEHLRTEMLGVFRNATDATRRMTFRPLTTISSGYDSPAVSLLARELGCGEAITFREARPGYASADDSGKAIADLMGLEVIEYSRDGYQTKDGFPEAEFLASGTGGEEVIFSVLEDRLPARLFFTGYFGDAVWSRHWPFAGTDFRIRNPAGASLTEFRLRLGFINFAVPVIGFVHQLRIHAISNSEEMRPWCTENGYDRPIPRRLLQEFGIPGHLFGQKKMAIAQPFYNKQTRMSLVMAEESYRDFQTFAKHVPLLRNRADRLWFAGMRALYEINLRVNWKIESVAKRFGSELLLDTVIPEKYKHPLRENALAFHWGIEKTMDRYRIPAAPPGRGQAGIMRLADGAAAGRV